MLPKLPPLNGKLVDVSRFEPFEPTIELMYYDGPLLFIFIASGVSYMSYYYDIDDEHVRWLIIPVVDTIKSMDDIPSLRTLIKDAPTIWLLDYDSNRKESTIVAACEVAYDSLPADSLPRD